MNFMLTFEITIISAVRHHAQHADLRLASAAALRTAACAAGLLALANGDIDDGGVALVTLWLVEPVEDFVVSLYVPFIIANSISCLLFSSSSPSGYNNIQYKTGKI